MTRNVLLIGIDAASFETIDPLIEEGSLPNIEAILSEGVRTSLESSVPPWTPTAWTSLTTGKNPGKHGIFDFKLPEDDRLATAGDVQANRLWDYLTVEGLRSIVVNVPVTHPASEMDGILIPGYLGPEIEDVTSYPEDIITELRDNIGDYRIYASGNHRTESELCDEYVDLLRMRTDAIIYLCDTYDWNFAMVQFQRTDTVFHELPEAEYIERVYLALDEFIGDIRSQVDADTIFLASDHGMGEPCAWDVRINTWLQKQGLLETTTDGYQTGWEKPGEDTSTSRGRRFLAILSAAGITAQRVERALARIHLSGLLKTVLPDKWLSGIEQVAGETIDTSESTAYCPSGPGLGIYCANETTESRIITELSELSDPAGDPVFEWVKPASEVHHGPETERGPDVLMMPRNMEAFVTGTLMSNVINRSRYEFNHRRTGMFAAVGDGIETREQEDNLHINDIAPTVLSLLDVPLDDAFDGVPRSAVLDGVTIPEKRKYDLSDRSTDTSQYDAVESRLEELGYL